MEGAREPLSFFQWQKEMREKDLQEELIKTERRRVERGINIEEAAMARTRIMERNQMTAQLKKEEVGGHFSAVCNKAPNEMVGWTTAMKANFLKIFSCACLICYSCWV